jgi:hypothetical protein
MSDRRKLAVFAAFAGTATKLYCRLPSATAPDEIRTQMVMMSFGIVAVVAAAVVCFTAKGR